MGATFRATYVDRTAFFSVQGELDLASREQLRWWLTDLTDIGLDALLVDVSGVTFVDCSCLRTLDEARRRLERGHARLEIVASSYSFGLVSGLAGYGWPAPPVPARSAASPPSHRAVQDRQDHVEGVRRTDRVDVERVAGRGGLDGEAAHGVAH